MGIDDAPKTKGQEDLPPAVAEIMGRELSFDDEAFREVNHYGPKLSLGLVARC